MRSYRVISLLQEIVSYANVTLGTILFWCALFVAGYVKCHHNKVIEGTKNCGVMLVIAGLFIIIIGNAAIRDSLQYTYGSEKVVATVTNIEEEYSSIDEETDYTYILGFPYEGQVISVRMHPSHKMPVNQGEYIELYFYPEEPGSKIEPVVVAVDLEVQLAKKNIAAGCISCIVGLFLLCLSSCKKRLLSDGVHISATVVQITSTSSRSNQNNNSKMLICKGKNPITGMMQTFRTKGDSRDFILLSSGDTVHVFVHKKYSNFYLINI